MSRTLKFVVFFAAAIAALFIIPQLQPAYIVREDEQALVLRFGAPDRSENALGQEDNAGLKFKIPFIENVRIYDRRNIELDLEPEPILASDQERLIVDAFVRYKITNVEDFYRRFFTRRQGEQTMRNDFDALLRNTLAEVPSQEIIAGQRLQLMKEILDRANALALESEWGVEFIDVRIMRADLPVTVAEEVFDRMVNDRNEQAAERRGVGERESRTIRAQAARTKEVTLAEARKQSEIIRGDGDQQRNAIYADAYNLDPEFFAFYRSMQAYERSLVDGTTYVLSPDSDFLGYLADQSGPRARR